MRALTIEELGYVSGGDDLSLGESLAWNPYSNPTKMPGAETPTNPNGESYGERMFKTLVFLEARHAVNDAKAADAAAAVAGPASGALASSGAAPLGPLASIVAGEVAGRGVESFVAAAGRVIPQKTREFYVFLYYSILAKYGY
jgi:hypothetical protein